MTAHRHFLRFAHTGPVHNPFYRRVVMQIVDNTFRVDVAGEAVISGSARSGTGRYLILPATRGRQLAADAAIHFRQRHDDLDFLRPERTLAAVQRYASNRPADKTTEKIWVC